MNKIKGLLALLLSGLIFGLFSIFIRLLSQDLDSYQQIAFRNTVACVFAVTIAVFLKSKWSINKVKKRYVLFYAFSFPLTIVFFTLSVLNTKIAISIFSLYIGSILSSLLIGKYFFNEKITKLKFLGLILVFIGLLIFAYPSLSQGTLNLGFIYGLLSGVTEAVANSFRKFLSGKIDRFVLVAIQMLAGIVLAVILMTLFNSSFIPYMSTTSLIVGLIFGLLLMTISFLALIGFQNFDLNLGTIIISSELFFGPFFAALAFKEYPATYEILGGLLIIVAIIVSNLNLSTKLIKNK